MPPRRGRRRSASPQPSPAVAGSLRAPQPRSSAAAPPPQIFASSDPLAHSSSPNKGAANARAFPVRKGASSPQDELPRRTSGRTRAPSRLAIEAAAASSSASKPTGKKQQPAKPRAQPAKATAQSAAQSTATGSDNTEAQMLREALEMSMRQLDGGNASTSSVSSPLRVTQPRAAGAGDRDEATALEQARIASTHEALMARKKRSLLLSSHAASPASAARRRANDENSSSGVHNEGPLHSTPLASLRRAQQCAEAAPSSPSPLPVQPRMRSLLDDAGLGGPSNSFVYSSDPLVGNDEIELVPLRPAGEVSLARQAMQRAAQPSGSSGRIPPHPQRALLAEEEGGRFALIRESARDGTIEENVARLLGTETARRGRELLRSQDEEEEAAVDQAVGSQRLDSGEAEIQWDDEADLDPFGFEEAERRVRERREMKLQAQEMQLALEAVAQEPDSPLAQCPDAEEIEAQDEESTSPPPFLPVLSPATTRSSPVQLVEELSTRPPATTGTAPAAPAADSSVSSRRSSRLASRVAKPASPSARRTSGKTRAASILASLPLVSDERDAAPSSAAVSVSSTDSASEVSSDDGLAFEPRARIKKFASQTQGAKGKNKSSSPLKTGRRAVKNTYATRPREPLRVEQMREFLPKRRVEPKASASNGSKAKAGKKQKIIRISDSEHEGAEEVDEESESSSESSESSDSRPPGGTRKGKAAAAAAASKKGKGKKPAPKRAAKAPAKKPPPKKAAAAPKTAARKKRKSADSSEEEEKSEGEDEADTPRTQARKRRIKEFEELDKIKLVTELVV